MRRAIAGFFRRLADRLAPPLAPPGRGRGVQLAPVQAPGLPVEEVELPEWLGPHVVREVTGEDEYLDENLAS